MKRLLLVIVAVTVLGVSGCSNKEAEAAAQQQGYNTGFTAGQDAGYKTGYDKGKQEGITAGKDEGFKDGCRLGGCGGDARSRLKSA